MGEIDYIVSDGYDCAQTAMCFLYRFLGRTVHEIYGKDKKGKEITIKLACYREVDRFIDTLRNRPDSHKQVEYIDFTQQIRRTCSGVTVIRSGTRHPKLLYERYAASRSVRGTGNRQRYYQSQESEYPTKVLFPVRRTLICRLTSYKRKGSRLYSDCLFSCVTRTPRLRIVFISLTLRCFQSLNIATFRLSSRYRGYRFTLPVPLLTGRE